MSAVPYYWRNDTSEDLQPAVEALLHDRPMTPDQVATVRAYFAQWIAGDYVGDDVQRLRQRVDGLASQEDLNAWLCDAIEADADPI